MSDRPKDPKRVMTGRMGALSVHARGRTNTAPATAARWAKYEKAVDPDGTLDPATRRKRAEYARRLDMTRIALRRWHGSAA
jgi:hypothetical protein